MSTPHFPGWYPDPDQPGRERLWDGQAWTQHLRKAAGQRRLEPAHDCSRGWKRCARMLVLIGGLVASGSDRGPTRSRAPGSRKQSTSCSRHLLRSTPTPKLAKVPAVKGLGLAKAKRKLRAAGLEVGDIDRRPSSKRKGTVLKQGVDKGTELEPGSSVTLVVAAPLPSGALGSWQVGSFGNQEAQECWLQGQEDNADQDHR